MELRYGSDAAAMTAMLLLVSYTV